MWTGKLYRGVGNSTPIWLLPAVLENDVFIHVVETGAPPVGKERNEVEFKELLC